MKNFTFTKDRVMGEEEIVFVPVDKIVQQTEDEYLLRFDVGIDHDPGQFMQCSLLGIGECPISICSWNNEYFEMSVRAVGNVSNALCKLKKGDELGLRGPYGNGYKMDDYFGKDLILVGGGCGVAPLRGVVEYVLQNRDKFGVVHHFFGFRTEEDILFREDFCKLEGKDMHCDLSLSDDFDCKIGKKGFVTDFLDPKTDPKKTVALLCGPPIMIDIAGKKLLSHGIQAEQIWVSAERHMKCGVGRCGHCMIRSKYSCRDGPVFRYDFLKVE